MKTLLSKLAVAVVAVVLLACAIVPAKAQTGGNNYTTYRSSIMSTGAMTALTLTSNTVAVGNADKPQVLLLPRGPNNWGFSVWASALGGGATATNLFYANFTCSRDGTNWVTAPSTGAGSIALLPPGFLQFNINMNGATAVQTCTNFPPLSFAGMRYIRLESTWHPGLTTITLSNIYGAAFSTPNP